MSKDTPRPDQRCKKCRKPYEQHFDLPHAYCRENGPLYFDFDTFTPMSNDKPFNDLTPAEAERLAILMEECAEVQQVIGKILRHGYQSYHPDDEAKNSNQTKLHHELGDLLAIVDMMIVADDLSSEVIESAKHRKKERVQRYLHHN